MSAPEHLLFRFFPTLNSYIVYKFFSSTAQFYMIFKMQFQSIVQRPMYFLLFLCLVTTHCARSFPGIDGLDPTGLFLLIGSPKITSHSPADGELNVLLNGNITLNFSENMTTTSLYASIADGNCDGSVQVFSHTDGTCLGGQVESTTDSKTFFALPLPMFYNSKPPMVCESLPMHRAQTAYLYFWDSRRLRDSPPLTAPL